MLEEDCFADHLEKLTWIRDSPLSEPADVPLYLLSQMAQAGRQSPALRRRQRRTVRRLSQVRLRSLCARGATAAAGGHRCVGSSLAGPAAAGGSGAAESV